MNTHPDTVRIFFALWPESVARLALAVWQQRLEGMGRTMRTDTLHVTLVFLGEVEKARLEALQLAASEVTARRFELRLNEARYWEHNRIIYAAPSVIPAALLQLVSDLQCSLEKHGFDFARREYMPHVTLLRNARREDPLPGMPAVRWHVKDFAMVRGGGPEYRVLTRFPLV